MGDDRPDLRPDPGSEGEPLDSDNDDGDESADEADDDASDEDDGDDNAGDDADESDDEVPGDDADESDDEVPDDDAGARKPGVIYRGDDDLESMIENRWTDKERNPIKAMIAMHGKAAIADAMAEMSLDIKFFLKEYKKLARSKRGSSMIKIQALAKMEEIRNYVLDLRQMPSAKRRIPKDEKIIRDLPKDVREEADEGDEWEPS